MKEEITTNTMLSSKKLLLINCLKKSLDIEFLTSLFDCSELKNYPKLNPKGSSMQV